MQTLFKIIVPVSLLVLLSATCQGQSQLEGWSSLTPQERADKLTAWMKEQVNLTPEQEPNVNSINLKYAKKAESLKTSNASNFEKLQSLKSYDEAKDKELKKVFTQAQYDAYQDKKDELREKIRSYQAG